MQKNQSLKKMKPKPKHIFFSLAFLIPAMTFAQHDFPYHGFTYSMSVPAVGTNDYINAGSFRGANYEGYYELKPKFALSWLLGWNVFNNELRNETYVDDNVTITGNQFRYQNAFPMLVRALYLFGVPEGIRPFVGAGLGVTYNKRRTDIGLYSLEADAWHFTMAPELGIMIPVGMSGITSSVRYNYAVKARDLGQQSYFSFNLGFMIVP
jgi:opacity protein-like surface antigen